ncbi:hypothetical protein KW796_00660 [Candidatus Parcubacteria bacterium]|nr:hypothetical protein [Candidatus Parcubacteria bacterium]
METFVRWEDIREAAQDRRKKLGLRETAKEMYLSYEGLQSFLDGRRSQESTRANLVAWYLWHKNIRVSNEDVTIAKGILVRHAFELRKPRARERRMGAIVGDLFHQLLMLDD